MYLRIVKTMWFWYCEEILWPRESLVFDEHFRNSIIRLMARGLWWLKGYFSFFIFDWVFGNCMLCSTGVRRRELQGRWPWIGRNSCPVVRSVRKTPSYNNIAYDVIWVFRFHVILYRWRQTYTYYTLCFCVNLFFLFDVFFQQKVIYSRNLPNLQRRISSFIDYLINHVKKTTLN